VQAAGYNPRHTMITGTWKISAVVACVLVLATISHTAQWDEATAALARNIASVSGPGTVSLEINNRGSIPGEKVPEIRRSLEAQLRSAGIRVTDANTAATAVTLTLSENIQGYLWVAQVKQGNDVRVVMQSIARTQAPVLAPKAKNISIHSTLLISQGQPILDATQLPGLSPYLAVLEPEQVVIYRMRSGSWSPEQSFPITHSRTWPRDLRGRLVAGSDHLLDVYLPGTFCASTVNAPLRMECRESDDPWPIGSQHAFFGASRNFFNGVLTPGIGKQTRIEPFYSAAALERPNYTLWTMTGVDGRVRQYDGFNPRIVSAAREWGSSVAAVKTDCGSILLATTNSDDTVADSLRAYEVADREPSEASAPAEFAGPITALWPSVDATSATAVVHNLKTATYEAHNVTLACNR
jgi:hypothetical protein